MKQRIVQGCYLVDAYDTGVPVSYKNETFYVSSSDLENRSITELLLFSDIDLFNCVMVNKTPLYVNKQELF